MIREAQWSDIGGACRVITEVSQRSVYGGYSIEQRRLRDYIKSACEADDQRVWVSRKQGSKRPKGGDGGKVEGVLIAELSKMLIFNAWVVSDVVFCVRSGGEGGLLLDRMIEWGREVGASMIQVTVTSGIEVDRVGKFLGRKGFECTGGVYRLV